MDPELIAAASPLPKVALPHNAPRMPSHVPRLQHRARDDSELGLRRPRGRRLQCSAVRPHHPVPPLALPPLALPPLELGSPDAPAPPPPSLPGPPDMPLFVLAHGRGPCDPA